MANLVSAFTAADWATLAAVHDSFLTDSCRIRPNVPSSVTVNGRNQTWPAVTSTVICAVLKQPTGAGVGEVPDQGMVPNSHTLVVPKGVTLIDPYHVEWIEGGITIEVTGTARARGTDATAVEMDCIEVPADV